MLLIYHIAIPIDLRPENKKILTILVLLVYDVILVHTVTTYLCTLFKTNISGFSPPFSEVWWRWFGGLEDKISKIVVFWAYREITCGFPPMNLKNVPKRGIKIYKYNIIFVNCFSMVFVQNTPIFLLCSISSRLFFSFLVSFSENYRPVL